MSKSSRSCQQHNSSGYCFPVMQNREGCPITEIMNTINGQQENNRLQENNGEIGQEDENISFEETFLDRSYRLKQDVHEKLQSFSWLRGAYGLTGPSKKIRHPHIYLTVKRGMTKEDVRRQLEQEFNCDPKRYFELLQEPRRKPKIKYKLH